MINTVLIKGGIIITLGDNPKVLYNHSVLIENGLIKKIAPSADFKEKYEKEIDANGKVVLPGFINAHMHFYSTLVRGLGKAKPSANFVEVLENLWWRLDKVLTPENITLGSIQEVIPNPGQWLLSVISPSNKEILIPLHEHFIVKIEKKKKQVIMDIPEGLTEIN